MALTSRTILQRMTVCVGEVPVVSSCSELDANLKMYGASRRDMILVLIALGFPTIRTRMSDNSCDGW
jgi:hypothetical protein